MGEGLAQAPAFHHRAVPAPLSVCSVLEAKTSALQRTRVTRPPSLTVITAASHLLWLRPTAAIVIARQTDTEPEAEPMSCPAQGHPGPPGVLTHSSPGLTGPAPWCLWSPPDTDGRCETHYCWETIENRGRGKAPGMKQPTSPCVTCSRLLSCLSRGGPWSWGVVDTKGLPRRKGCIFRTCPD